MLNNNSEPFVSVVTPVYNTGDYLEQAIQSVLAQSYRNFEYIICENHSTDRSAEIADKYARADSRVRVVRPPRFLPQAQNFNYALQQIAPESAYCKMLLADDWMFPNCLGEMVSLAAANPSVAVVSSYRLIETEGACFGLPVDQTVISGRVAGRLHLLNGIFLFGTPSTVMYRSDIVRSRSPRFYSEERFFHDTDAVFDILSNQDFGFVHQVLTFSRYQPGSITHKVRSFYARAIDRIIVLHNYGSRYLDPDELERCTARARRVYYEGLGSQWLKDRFQPSSEEFWTYHKKRLAEIGEELSPKLLAFGTGATVVRSVGSPFDFVREFVRSRRPVEDPYRKA